MHVRDSARVRDELAAQVAAGADILVAPTWLTHRRALVAVGETRRARAWTDLAVRLARQSSEVGRERLEVDRVVRVLGVLPDPAAIDEEASGQQLRPDAAAERDERAQIGLLAEASVDGILIEPRPSLERTRVALRAVVEHEVEAWVAVPGERPDGLTLTAWSEAMAADGAALVLLPSLSEPDTEGEQGAFPFGVLAPDPLRVPDPRGAAAAWLEAGASVIGIAAEANPETLRPLVEARDAAIAAHRETSQETQATIDAWVRDAARRATGGRALWVGDQPVSLPDGFAWTIVSYAEIGTLPPDTWRLLVSDGPLDPRDAGRLVERGGIIAAAAGDVDTLASVARAAGVRLDLVTPPVAGECRYIGRRED
jgi:hypothetical protein